MAESRNSLPLSKNAEFAFLERGTEGVRILITIPHRNKNPLQSIDYSPFIHSTGTPQ
jgi:hypothetical protein